MKEKSTKQSLRSLRVGNTITVLVIITPYLFYSYEIFPVGNVWENYFFTYTSGFYESVSIAFWVIMGKLIPLLLMIAWFISCKHWWYRIILIPISMYAYQFVSAILEEKRFMDENDLGLIVPIVLATVALTYLSRMKLQDLIQSAEMKKFEKNIPKPSDYFFKD